MPSVSLHTQTIAFAEYGQPGGFPVFYFHGWPGSHVQAELADASARANGVHLVSPDRPGFGKSPFVADRRLLDWPRTVAALADHLGWDRFGVLGVSGGGPYALACAHVIPERLSRVVVACGIPHYDWLRQSKRARWFMRGGIRLGDRWPGSLRGAMRLFAGAVHTVPYSMLMAMPRLFMPPPDRAALKDRESRRILGNSVVEAFRGPSAGVLYDLQLLTSDWGFRHEDIAIPVRLFHGDRDVICPLEDLEPVIADKDYLRLTVIPGEGHYSLAIGRVETLIRSCLP